MERVKIIVTNILLATGTTIGWTDGIEAVLRVLALIITALVGVFTLEKLIKERRKRKEP